MCDALSILCHKDKAHAVGKNMCERLRDEVPRQLFAISIQAAVGSKIIARENIKPFRKDVTGDLYGGDRTRRMKLLEKQKEGKKRMKKVGSVELDRDTFYNVISSSTSKK